MGFEGAAAVGERMDVVCGRGGDLVTIYMIVSMYICIIGYLNTYFAQGIAWFELL
jgi:hypothetical protein